MQGQVHLPYSINQALMRSNRPIGNSIPASMNPRFPRNTMTPDKL